jgi:hypothetical protein
LSILSPFLRLDERAVQSMRRLAATLQGTAIAIEASIEGQYTQIAAGVSPPRMAG